MADNDKGLVTAGLSLLWRRQGILWWVFAVNFACGALGTLPVALTLNGILHHTLAAQALSKGFDLGMAYELLRLPGVGLMRSSAISYVFAGLFFLFMLFVSGGILEAYRQDRRLSTGDFFAASGAFFWRFARLMLFSLVPFVFLWSLSPMVDQLSDYVGDRVVADQVGIFMQLAGTVVLALLAFLVRLWFDLAKVRAVALNERSIWGNMWKACGLTWRHLGTLFWMYLRISLVAWIALLIGFLIWTKLPPTAVPATFVILELIMLVQVGTRLWQLSSATAWYQRHPEEILTAPVAYVAPSEETAEASPSAEPWPLPGPDLELPLGNA